MLIVTSTDLKNNTADILNHAYYNNSPVIVIKNGKSFVKVVRVNDQDDSKETTALAWNKLYGTFPMVSTAIEIRKSRFTRENRV